MDISDEILCYIHLLHKSLSGRKDLKTQKYQKYNSDERNTKSSSVEVG